MKFFKISLLADYCIIDFLFIVYMLFFSILILFFHNGVSDWYMYILLHALIIAAILILVPFSCRSKNRLMKILRWWYPILLFSFNYKEINSFTHIIVPFWKDSVILHFEKILIGYHPTLVLENYANPLLNEIMKFDYFSYYFMILVSAFLIYNTGNMKKYIRFLSTVCLAFYISYIGFILFPVRGPRYSLYDRYNKDYEVIMEDYYGPYIDDDMKGLRTKALDGYFFAKLQDHIMKYGSLHGGCMPSSHIAVAFVCLFFMFGYSRKVFYVYLPFVALLCISVVYNRYHYVSDVIAGIIVAVISSKLLPLLEKSWFRLKNH